MKRSLLAAALVAASLFAPSAFAQVYSNISWGCALTGSWNFQVVHLDTGSSCIQGNLPGTQIDTTGASTGYVLTAQSGGGSAWQAPTGSTPLSGTTGNIGGGLLTIGACTSGTVTVTGATTSMAATASPVTYPGDGSDWKAYVSSANTVTVKVCAIIALTPTASNYNVRVFQ